MLHQIIDRIREQQNISREELEILLTTEDKEALEYLRTSARAVADAVYGEGQLQCNHRFHTYS